VDSERSRRGVEEGFAVLARLLPQDAGDREVAAELTDVLALAPGPDQQRVEPVDDLQCEAQTVPPEVAPFEVCELVQQHVRGVLS
jgi:hypothetical protein